MIDPTAKIEIDVKFGKNVNIWRNSHVRSKAIIGDNVTIGENVYIGTYVVIGDNCKIQNGAQIYEPAIIENGVFIGPGVCLTNDKFPRAVNENETIKTANDWSAAGVVVQRGASIGAGVICIAPIKIGEWAMIGAGSVVTSNVSDFGLYVGNPARQIGWVNKEGYKLNKIGDKFYCKENGSTYQLIDSKIIKDNS